MKKRPNYLSLADVPTQDYSPPHWIFYLGAFASLASAFFSFVRWRKR